MPIPRKAWYRLIDAAFAVVAYVLLFGAFATVLVVWAQCAYGQGFVPGHLTTSRLEISILPVEAPGEPPETVVTITAFLPDGQADPPRVQWRLPGLVAVELWDPIGGQEVCRE